MIFVPETEARLNRAWRARFLADLFNPSKVARELMSAVLVWGPWLVLRKLLSNPEFERQAVAAGGLMEFVATHQQEIFWICALASAVSFIVACAKSLLAPFLALVASVGLIVAGAFMPGLAGAATVALTITFVGLGFNMMSPIAE